MPGSAWGACQLACEGARRSRGNTNGFASAMHPTNPYWEEMCRLPRTRRTISPSVAAPFCYCESVPGAPRRQRPVVYEVAAAAINRLAERTVWTGAPLAGWGEWHWGWKTAHRS